MKEIKKGYRLTREEEAIMRGEIPGSENAGNEPQPENENNPKKKKGRALGALLPVLIALGMMIGIAYLFMWLVNTPERRAAQAAEQNESKETIEQTAGIPVITEEQKALFQEELSLTEEESAAFWPLYTRFCDDMETIREEYRKWTTAQSESSAEPESPAEAYLTANKELNNTKTRYTDAFTLLLGEERASMVLRIYATQNLENELRIP